MGPTVFSSVQLCSYVVLFSSACAKGKWGPQCSLLCNCVVMLYCSLQPVPRASGARSVLVCATVRAPQPPVTPPKAALSVHQASREATAMKTKTNVTTTHVVPMPTARTQLVPSVVTVMPATSRKTPLHVLVCRPLRAYHHFSVHLENLHDFVVKLNHLARCFTCCEIQQYVISLCKVLSWFLCILI